ncbi:MAG TPA: hypothetical protein VFT00_06960 [Nocardioides sp.]|nr:hypothetical protein [Nocardioides sp.]
MLVVTLVMLVIVALAALVVTYVAYPHRGEEVPAAPWLGDAMARAVEAAPTLPSEEEHQADHRFELPDEAGDARRAG